MASTHAVFCVGTRKIDYIMENRRLIRRETVVKIPGHTFRTVRNMKENITFQRHFSQHSVSK